MKFAENRPVKIVMLGAGGTGGHIAPHLYRLLYALERPVRFIICDGDIVEEKNLVRQNFTPADLGENKAKVLAERYSSVFGMETEYVPEFIESGERLLSMLRARTFPTGPYWHSPTVKELVILIGAVDNNKSRKLCHEVFYKLDDLIYIDSGNGMHTGQIVCGIRSGGRTFYRPVGAAFPEVLQDTDKFPTELSCAEASVSAPQSIAANITAATAVVDMIYNILTVGETRVRQITFATGSVNMRATLQKSRKKQRKKERILNMKTVYIPAGATYNYETLVTDDVIIHGHLHVTNGLKAKHISGRGFITAGEVSADIVDVTELECGTVICRRLLAQRVSVNEALVSESAAVSRFFSANYVKAPSLTVAVSEIGEADVDEIVHLTPKPRGMLLTLLFSNLRTFWLRLTASRPQGRFEKPRTESEEPSDTPEDAETKANIAKIVQEVLAQQAAEKAACENDANDVDDFELQRIIGTFKLLRTKGYTMRILPGTPEENAPVFDFAAESIQPAA